MRMRKKLINLRKKKSFTRKAMAQKLKTTVSFYIKIESGNNSKNIGAVL